MVAQRERELATARSAEVEAAQAYDTVPLDPDFRVWKSAKDAAWDHVREAKRASSDAVGRLSEARVALRSFCGEEPPGDPDLVPACKGVR